MKTYYYKFALIILLIISMFSSVFGQSESKETLIIGINQFLIKDGKKVIPSSYEDAQIYISGIISEDVRNSNQIIAKTDINGFFYLQIEPKSEVKNLKVDKINIPGKFSVDCESFPMMPITMNGEDGKVSVSIQCLILRYSKEANGQISSINGFDMDSYGIIADYIIKKMQPSNPWRKRLIDSKSNYSMSF